jgi:hypothetical protein
MERVMQKLPMRWFPSGWALVLAALCLFVSSLPARAQDQDDPPTRVARLSYVDGDVSFQPGGEDDWGWGSVNRPLTTGDALWVENGSRAELAIGANVMRLGPETDFSFLDLDDDITQIELSSGTLSFTVRHLSRGEIVEIDTPNLVVILDAPGTYRVDADPYGDFTSVTVRDGRAEILGGGQSLYLDSGSELQAEGVERLRFAVYDAPPPDDLDRFCDSRDRRFERSESARYVSFDVTGYVDLDGNGAWRTDPSYGPVWVPRVARGWAPFRDGTWAWIDPWGWTWIDEVQWGFATSHYGRWVRIGRPYVWAWVPPRPARRGPHGPQPYPGPVAERCIYSPANVTFLGSPNEARVAWFPLAPGEVYVPGFHASLTFIQQLNITNTTVQINVVTNVIQSPAAQVRYVNRVPEAVVAVPRTVFVSAQPVARARVEVSAELTARAPIVRAAPVAPARASVFADVKVKAVASAPPPPKPPAEVRTRKVVVKTTPPPKRATFVQKQRELTAEPGKPVDRKTERTIAAATPAPPAPVVKAEAPAAPPKEATAAVPKTDRREARKAIRKVDRNPQARTSPATPPAPQPQAAPDETPPPPPPGTNQDDAARRAAAEKTRQEQEAARRAEAEKRRADEQAARTAEAQKTPQQQDAARRAEAEKKRADEQAARTAEAQKTTQEQEVARRAEAEKKRADEQAARTADAQKTAQEQEAARTAEAEKKRADEQAARTADAQKRRAEQEAARVQAEKTRQEQEAARRAEAQKKKVDEQVAQQTDTDQARVDQEAGRGKGTRTPAAPAPPRQAVKVAESTQAAKLVSKPEVVPPPDAKDVHGTVVVRARIGADGKVKNVQYLRGPKQLERAALQNARARVYQPTLVDGSPIEVDTEISVTF